MKLFRYFPNFEDVYTLFMQGGKGMDEQRVREIVKEELTGIGKDIQPVVKVLPGVNGFDMDTVAKRIETRLTGSTSTYSQPGIS